MYYSPLLGIHNSYVVISQVESSTSIDQFLLMKSFIFDILFLSNSIPGIIFVPAYKYCESEGVILPSDMNNR